MYIVSVIDRGSYFTDVYRSVDKVNYSMFKLSSVINLKILLSCIKLENQLSIIMELLPHCIKLMIIPAEADGPASGILQEANIGIYTIPECEALWSEEQINDEEHVCIGTPNEAGSCSVSFLVLVVGKWKIKKIYHYNSRRILSSSRHIVQS